MKLGFWRRESQYLETDLNWRRDLTGNLERMSINNSSGSFSIAIDVDSAHRTTLGFLVIKSNTFERLSEIKWAFWSGPMKMGQI